MTMSGAAVTEGPAGGLTTLDHLVIAVRDLDAAVDTFARLLGRAASWRGVDTGGATAHALFRLARTDVELLAPAGEGPESPLAAQLAGADEGLCALAFGTTDAAACAGQWRARGLSAGAPIEGGGRDGHTGAERHWRMVHVPRRETRGVRLFAIEHRSPADTLPLAAPLDPNAAVAGVDHVVIMTGDADAACRLYRDRVGLRLALDRTFETRGIRLLFLRIGGVTVELAAPLGAPAADTDRLWGISWRVADIDAARTRVAGAGFDVSPVRPGHKAGTRVCSVRGAPHGVAMLLIAPEA